jgi:3-oxoacyl-[acyl-carrier-protein] synthase II
MPFEADRIGMKVAEGYGIVILERAEDALARKARPLGWLAGSGERSDAYHLTQPQPDGSGAARALQIALSASDGEPPEWILAHATATPANDGAEYAAYRGVLADRLPEIPVTALKSRLGHSLGAAGALELVLALTAQESGLMATTAEGTTDHEGFPDLNVLRGDPVERSVERLAVLSLGFGGADACLRVNRGASGATVPTRRDQAVVFTGIGALLPGLGARRGIETGRDLEGVPGPVEGPAFDGLDDPRATRRLAQISRLARAAGRLAIEDAELHQDLLAESDALVGTFHGAAEYSLDYYRELVEGGIEMGNPLLFAESVPNIGSAQVSLALGVKGATMTVIGTRTAAVEALHLARLRIQCGLAERVLVIGTDEFVPIITEVMRDRGLLELPDGREQQIGSGAIAFLVESESSARSRKAKIHGRLATTGIAWPKSSELPARIRTGRRLLAEHAGSRRVRTTSSFGPIGRLEFVTASQRSLAATGNCEMQSLAPLFPVVEALHDGLPTAIVAADFHGGSAVISIDPC